MSSTEAIAPNKKRIIVENKTQKPFFNNLIESIVDSMHTHFSVFFIGADSTPLFFSLTIRALEEQLKQKIIFLGEEFCDLADIRALGDLTCLGQTSCYILKNFDSLDRSIQQYICDYSGPNNFLCVCESKKYVTSQSAEQIINFEREVSREEYYELYCLAQKVIEKNNVFVHEHEQRACNAFSARVYHEHKSLALDTALMIMHYQAVLGAGKRAENFFVDWIDRIVFPKRSLYTLSQHFFAKNNKAFFVLWQHLREVYPIEFWLTYWSEQLWQASIYVLSRQQNREFTLTKNRLSYSFIQKDWRQYNYAELAQAHMFLYELDSRLKSGCSIDWLDYFFMRFMCAKFK